ncbi:MAG: outer membrane lipid asymmetry maintenance protein MlaD [Desulfobacterales bacterium]
MKKTTIDTSVGIFMLIGIACVGYLTIKLGKMEWFGQNQYSVFAKFDSITGLKKGGQIEMAGVQIGHIADISLDFEKQVAVVEMKIQNKVVLTDDVIASVKTAGLIGDKYIKLSPGGSDEILKPGGLITETESALDLEELVSKYVFGGVK